MRPWKEARSLFESEEILRESVLLLGNGTCEFQLKNGGLQVLSGEFISELGNSVFSMDGLTIRILIHLIHKLDLNLLFSWSEWIRFYFVSRKYGLGKPGGSAHTDGAELGVGISFPKREFWSIGMAEVIQHELLKSKNDDKLPNNDDIKDETLNSTRLSGMKTGRRLRRSLMRSPVKSRNCKGGKREMKALQRGR